MEQILTSKKIVERNLSIVKHINDKYVLFKDDNKITVDDRNPNVSSVYGVTTIDKLMSVKGYGEVPYLIVIHNDPKKEPYFVTSIPTKFIDCKYLPTDAEYSEYVYGNHYLRYDKIVDKWFSKCKKEVVD